MKKIEKKQKKTERAIITSANAKEHLLSARSMMDEMNASIILHKQNLFNQKMKDDSSRKESEKMDIQNRHELTLQEQKLNAVNSLI